jgi:hypothetical protein
MIFFFRQDERMQKIGLDSVVALLRDIPEEGLIRGQVGTVVQPLTPGRGIVEFCDDEGETYAIPALPYEALMALHYGPVANVAWGGLMSSRQLEGCRVS